MDNTAKNGIKDMETEYDNSGRVGDSASLLDDYIADAVEYRNSHADTTIFNQSYGPKERNKLDIFWPGGNHDVPLTMFIHGGYWQRLDRSAFSHMARGLNARGVAVAIPSYTLCPNIKVSGIIDEMRRACVILWKTYDKSITVFGHSAGGHLAACMLATKWNRMHIKLPKQLVQSALAISGVFELAPLMQTSHNSALKITEEEARSASPYNWLIEPGQRFDAWVGSEESSEFLRQSRSQAQRWRMMGATTRYQEIPGANHFTAINPLTDPGSPMVARILELMKPAKPLTLADLNIAEPKQAELEIVEKKEETPAADYDESDEEAVEPEGSEPQPDDTGQIDASGNGGVKEHPDQEGGDEPEQDVIDTVSEETKEPAEQEPVAQPVVPANLEEENHTEFPLEAENQSVGKDDLTIISGIGDVLQSRLNDLGFATYAQLADLTDTEKKMIEDALDFKGRIKREHWITQARHQKAIKELAMGHEQPDTLK